TPLNTRAGSSVERGIRIPAYVMGIALAIHGLAGAACVEVEGGALELSWSVRAPDGRSSSCRIGGSARPALSHVRVCWQPLVDGSELDQTCSARLSERFRCELEHG